jgi:hypothetical protein
MDSLAVTIRHDALNFGLTESGSVKQCRSENQKGFQGPCSLIYTVKIPLWGDVKKEELPNCRLM